MSLSNIGKLSDSIKKVSYIAGNEFFTEESKLKGINKYIDKLDSLDDVNALFKHAGVDKELAKAALETSKFANELSDIDADGIKKVDKAIDGLSDGSDIFDNIGNSFKGLWLSIKPLLPAIAGLTIAMAAFAAIDYSQHGFTRAVEEAESAASEYETARSNVNSLNSELKTTVSRIEELESLQANGALTFAEETELENLKLQNAELEQQLDLQNKILEAKQKASATAAMRASESEQSYIEQAEEKGGFLAKLIAFTSYANEDKTAVHEWATQDTSVEGQINSNIQKLQEYKNELKSIQDQLKDDPTSENLLSKQKQLQESISNVTSDLGTQANTLQSWIDQSTDEFGIATEDAESYVDAWRKTLAEINNIGKSQKDIDLNNLETYFSSSTGSHMKKYLRSVVKESGDAEDALEAFTRTGMSLEDIGVTQDGFIRYFEDIAKSSKEAKKSVQDYASTVEDIESATESENQDKAWSTASEAYQEAKKLLKEGKTGTDDFQSVASFLNPETVKKYAEKSGKYTADAYQKAFEKVQKTANRWFGKDETKSMENFVNDFKKKGLFDVKTDDMGLWDIETNFKTTAEAAKEFGISVEAVETMLKGLEAYGYDFDGITFSADGLSEYEGYLNNLHSLYDSMSDGAAKNRLGGLLTGWDEELSGYKEDLDSLTKEQIVHIKFEYDMATIRADIDKLKSQQAGEGGKDATTNASIIAANESLLSKQREGLGLNEKNFEFEAKFKLGQETIGDLYKQLENAERDSDEFYEIQAKIQNAQELESSIYDLFSEQHPEINAESNVKDIEEAWEDFFSRPQRLTVDGELDKSYIESQLAGLEEGSVIEFKAEVNGAEETIEAIKNEDGTITYQAQIGDAVQTLKPVIDPITNTITYVAVDKTGAEAKSAEENVNKVENSTVTISAIDKTSAGVKSANTSLNGIDGKTVHTYIKVHTDNISVLSGTAHKSGTLGGLYPIPKLGGRALAMGTLRDDSWLKSHWKTKKGEYALTGEVGQEIVVNGNRWWTVGDDGAEFRYIPPKSVVFDAAQTKQLLSKGKINGRAHLEGTAYRLGGTSSSTSGSSSTANKTTQNDGKSAKDTTSTSKKVKEVFDKIEILISRMERSFEHLTDSIETYSYDLSKQMSISDKAIDTAKGNIDVLEKAKNRYLKEANKVNLSKAWKEDIRNGEVDLTKVRSQKLLDNIKKYQEYYEKYLDTEDKILEAQQDLLDLAVEKIENIDKYYGNRFTYDENIGHRTDLSEFQKVVSTLREELEKQVSDGVITKHSNEWYDAMELIAEREQELLEATWERYEDVIDYLSRATDVLSDSLEYKEARGEKLSESDYASQIDINNKKIKELYNAILQYEKDISVYDFGTEKYDELADKISDAKSEIYGLLSTNEELEDSIWDVRFTEPFDELINGIDQTIESTDNLRALLNEDAFFDKNGVITEDGLANISLLNQSLNESKQKVAEYTEGLKILDEAYANGTISESKYKEAQAEMISGLQDSVASVQDYKNELIDLYKQQAQNEADYLTDIIDKYAEAKDKKAQYWDYNKKIQNQTKSINMLKAELAVLEGSNNEADIARAKKLRAEISEAEDSLAEEKRNHSLDMQQDGYDAMKDNIAQILEDTEYEIAHNAEKQESVISSMLGNVVSMYADAYGKINQIIYDTGFIGNSSSTQNITNSGTESGISAQAGKGNAHQSQIIPSASVSGTNTSSINANSGNDKVIDHISKSVDKDNRPVAELSLSKSSISLEEGKSTSVTVSIRPSDAANKKLSWTSSNSKIATVSNGKITAKSPGTCVVTASTKDGSGISKKVNVTVTPKPKAKAESVKTDDGKKSTSNVGDGKAKVGDKVTFKSGRYYYDSYGKNPAGNKYLGKSVYITKINKGSNRPYHISTGKKLGNGDLGWVTLSQLKGYAKGSSGILKDQLARTQEEGLEFILRDGSVLTPLSEGDKILTAAQTRNMMDWAKVDPKDYILPGGLNPSNYIDVKHDGGVRIEQHYDSLLTVNGNVDKDALPPLKDLLEQSYRYNMDKMYKEANKIGFKRVR